MQHREGSSPVSRLCDFCGEGQLTPTEQTEHFSYGTDKEAVVLSAKVPVWSCNSCDLSFTDETAEQLRHEAVCKHLGRLTPKAIRSLRESHNLSQEAFASLTGHGVASIKRWESGTLVQNEAADTLFRLLHNQDTFKGLLGLRATHPTIEQYTFRTQLSEQVRLYARRFELRPTSTSGNGMAA